MPRFKRPLTYYPDKYTQGIDEEEFDNSAKNDEVEFTCQNPKCNKKCMSRKRLLTARLNKCVETKGKHKLLCPSCQNQVNRIGK